MTVAREGYPFIIGSLVPGLLLAALYPVHGMAALLVIGLLLTLFGLICVVFFRNPARTIPADDTVLVAPADGRVLAVRDVDDEYVGPACRIDIFLSVYDVHLNRMPAAGTVEFVHYRAGKFFSAFKDKASLGNERNDIGIAGRWGKLRVAQIAGWIARRIICRVQAADQVQAGQVCGMIRFGSRTEITFSKRYAPSVVPGQRVRGGETIVGKLIEHA
jgi:phosphatidylserine decarboxylase